MAPLVPIPHTTEKMGPNDSANTSGSVDDMYGDVHLPIPQDIAVTGVVLGSLIIALGTFGNALIILSVLAYKSLSKASNMFVVSLAVCDMFQTVCVKPLYVHTYLVGEWQFGESTCLYALLASNLTILESIIHVSVIALYRYVIIVHPIKARCFLRRRSMWLFLLAMYLLPLLVVMVPSLARAPTQEIVFNKRIMFCSFVRHNEFRLGGVLKKVIFLGVTAAFLLFCYVRIIQKVRESRQSVNSQGRYSSSRIRKEMMLLKTVIAMFGSFVLTYLPVSIVYGVDTEREFPYFVYFVGVMLLWSSSSANWIIYGCVNRQYSAAYQYLFRKLCSSHTSRLDLNIQPTGTVSHSRRSSPTLSPTNNLFRFRFSQNGYSSVSNSVAHDEERSPTGGVPPLQMSLDNSPFVTRRQHLRRTVSDHVTCHVTCVGHVTCQNSVKGEGQVKCPALSDDKEDVPSPGCCDGTTMCH